mgnify:CR=1 FL=1
MKKFLAINLILSSLLLSEDISSFSNKVQSSQNQTIKSNLANPNYIEGEGITNEITSKLIQSGEKEAIQNVTATFVYNENDMYTIYSRVNNISVIMLQPNEKISYIAGGDTARWGIDYAETGSEQGTRQCVYIKPFQVGLRTNLIINTDKRSYQFNLYSAKEWFNPQVNFRYPKDEIALAIKKDKVEEEVYVTDLTKLNEDYNIKDNRLFKKVEFTPKQVFDDGLKTYLVMPTNLQEMPVIYIIDDEDTKENLQLVNYRTKGRYIIIDRLFNEAKLVLGKKEVSITKK